MQSEHGKIAAPSERKGEPRSGRRTFSTFCATWTALGSACGPPARIARCNDAITSGFSRNAEVSLDVTCDSNTQRFEAERDSSGEARREGKIDATGAIGRTRGTARGLRAEACNTSKFAATTLVDRTKTLERALMACCCVCVPASARQSAMTDDSRCW